MSNNDELVRILREIAPNARGIGADSRRIQPDDIFLAFPGAAHDGRAHIANAIQAGAAAVVWEPEGHDWDSAWRRPHLPVANLKARVAALAASPVSGLAKAVPSQSTSPAGCAALTASQFTKMKVKGQAARIQPIVPPMRIRPNSLSGFFMLANAIELVIEIVGT